MCIRDRIYPGKGLRFAREEWVDTMTQGIEAQFVSQQSVDTLLDTPIKWNDGSTMTYTDKFPVEAVKMRGAVAKAHLAMKQESDALEKSAKELWKFENIENHEGVKDLDWVRDTARSWREKFKTTEYPEAVSYTHLRAHET